MNAKKIFAAVAVFAAANSAFAAEWVEFSDFKSTRTRAEVIAEMKQAQADGTYAAARQEAPVPAANFASGKTRAQVVAELEQSKADGSYALMHQEYQGQFPGLTTGANAGTRLAGSANAGNAN
ncbi:MAG TPA: DUF4148 domain-containing protein [Noviherbaspirillum sp.]|jgi:hypothetical protein|uniref:DUF4148 domain-containing protein n=1 Tax=Noviherbaspirillum sp. TaxID=1926288 RepID=UPI002F94F499